MPTHSSLSATVTDSETDAELLSRFIKSGDGLAFSKLVERHLNLVFGAACRRTESRELAQEAAQNSFCQLARHAARVRVRESLAPWLHKVAIREAGTLLRSERSRQRTLRRLAVSVAGGGARIRSAVRMSGPLLCPRARRITLMTPLRRCRNRSVV